MKSTTGEKKIGIWGKIQKGFFHDILGWGYSDGYQSGGDSFHPTTFCRFCDGRLAQDSNGDWFHLSDYK
jgi:hypothetical protein